MTLIFAYQNRGKTLDIVIRDANEDPITPEANDNVRAIIGREGEDAKLTVLGGSPTPNGSSFTPGSTNRLRLDASDLAEIEPGTYSLIVDFYDEDDVEEWKTVEREVIVIAPT